LRHCMRALTFLSSQQASNPAQALNKKPGNIK
jgi:hypothetical protein